MDAKEHIVGSIELVTDERDLLLELFASAEKELLAQIDHTDSRDYRVRLEKRFAVLESLKAKVSRAADKQQ